MTLATTPRGIAFQERDIELLRGLFESRLMTLAHTAALYFEGKPEAAKKRVQRLKAAGLVGERPRRAYEPSVLFLTRCGFTLLQERGVVTAYPESTWANFEKRSQVKSSTLRHELDVMDVKAALVSAVRSNPTFQIAEFSTWPRLCEFRARDARGDVVTVKPDGFIRIRENTASGEVFEHTFFLEVDRSTETQDTLALKAACYRDYYRSGGFALKNGRPRSEFENFPFRLLVVFQSGERRNNAAERLLLMHPPILSQVWLTTFAEITSAPLKPIWVRPLDYRNATIDTPFAPSDTPRAAYRRQAEREAHVEMHVMKHALLIHCEVTSSPSQAG